MIFFNQGLHFIAFIPWVFSLNFHSNVLFCFVKSKRLFTTEVKTIYATVAAFVGVYFSFQNKDVTKQPSSTNRFATFRAQGSQNHRGNRQLRSTNRNIADQSSSHIEDSQRLATSNERHTLPVRSVSQDLPGLIPPRDIDTRPPDNEAGDKQPNRRMAVCSVTDCASFQRTKMRVYRKRF